MTVRRRLISRFKNRDKFTEMQAKVKAHEESVAEAEEEEEEDGGDTGGKTGRDKLRKGDGDGIVEEL